MNKMQEIWIDLQVAWDFKWYILGFLIVFGFLISLAHAIIEVFINITPESIGEFFGRIVKGFKDVK